MQENNSAVPPEKLLQLVTRVSQEYNVIAYHNFTHAYSVFQMTALALSYPSLQSFQGLPAFSAMIAALAHDMKHRGVNNAYHN